MYPYMFPEESLTKTSQQIERLLNLTMPVGRTVLDLACGPGRHSIALAKAGYHVTSVDKTKYLLGKAHERAKGAEADIEWVHMDMRDFARADSFDLVINMGVSFGYFNDKHDDLRVLDNILLSLKAGGVCLIDTVGREHLVKTLRPTTSQLLPDGAKLIEQHEVFDEWTQVRSKWTLIQKNRTKNFKFRRTIYSGQELKDRMRQAGFTGVKLYGNIDGDKYGPEAPRLVAVGRKDISGNTE